MECPERVNDQMRIIKSPVESPGIASRKAFDELAEGEGIERYRQLSLAVLQRYPLHNPRLEYIGQFEKIIFRVEAGELRRFAFRIHQSSTSAIEPQIAWLTALSRETNLRVPEPIPAEDGTFIQQVEGWGIPQPRQCTLLRWVEGEFFDEHLTPAHLRHVGILTASLHEHSETFSKHHPDIQRRVARLTDYVPTWMSDDQAKEFYSEDDLLIFTRAAERMLAELRDFPREQDQLIIHGDIHQDNYLFDDGEVGIIDFGHCGWGYPVVDLTVTLFNLDGRANLPALRDAFLEGYASVRTLPPGWEQLEALQISQYLDMLEQRFGWIGSVDAEEREQMRRESVERCRRYLEV